MNTYPHGQKFKDSIFPLLSCLDLYGSLSLQKYESHCSDYVGLLKHRNIWDVFTRQIVVIKNFQVTYS